MSDWYVQAYRTGTESTPTQKRMVPAFEPAFAWLKALKADGAAVVGIGGPHTAIDGQHQAIVQAGGVPTWR